MKEEHACLIINDARAKHCFQTLLSEKWSREIMLEGNDKGTSLYKRANEIC